MELNNSRKQEAAVTQSPVRLRNLFAIMVAILCSFKSYGKFIKKSLSEDVLFNVQRDNPGIDIQYTETIFNEVMILIEDKLLSLVGRNLSDYGMCSGVEKKGLKIKKCIRFYFTLVG